MKKALLILAVVIFTTMAQAQTNVKFILTSYQRIDLREENSNRFEETNFVLERSLLIIDDNKAKISGAITFDLMLAGEFDEGEGEGTEEFPNATKYQVACVDMEDGERGILSLTRFEGEGEFFWGVYVVWPEDSKMYYQFIATPVK